MMKTLIIAMLCAISSSTFADEKSGNKRYVLGGTVGTLVGFGSGHAIQQRWEEDGKLFTYGEVGALMTILMGRMIYSMDQNAMSLGIENYKRSPGGIVMIAGAALFVGLRLCEIYDVWFEMKSNEQSPELQVSMRF